MATIPPMRINKIGIYDATPVDVAQLTILMARTYLADPIDALMYSSTHSDRYDAHAHTIFAAQFLRWLGNPAIRIRKAVTDVGEVVGFVSCHYQAKAEQEGREQGEYDNWEKNSLYLGIPQDIGLLDIKEIGPEIWKEREEKFRPAWSRATRQGDCIIFNRLCVDPDWQQSGIATLLLHDCTNLADSRRLPILTSTNSLGAHVYTEFGFSMAELIEIDLSKWGGEGFWTYSIMSRPSLSASLSSSNDGNITMSSGPETSDWIFQRSSPISIEPVTLFDIPTITVLDARALDAPFQRLVFGDDLRNNTAFLNMRAGMFLPTLSEKRAFFRKAVADTGEIVGASSWMFYEQPRERSKLALESVETDKNEKVPEKNDQKQERESVNLPEGTNIPALADFFGTAGQTEDRLMGQKKYAKLSLMIVAPEWQRRGVGSLLLQDGIDKATELGLPVYLNSTEAGYRLYEKAGFRVVESSPFDMEKHGGKGSAMTYRMLRDLPT